MTRMNDKKVKAKFDTYPPWAREKLLAVRELIFEVAKEDDDIGEIEEALKWGEPGYLAKGGSTIRVDWKESNPDVYAVYFHCQTRLVETFREVYGSIFKYDGNRAIVFKKNEQIPVEELKQCIALSLKYHKVKHLPLLGIQVEVKAVPVTHSQRF